MGTVSHLFIYPIKSCQGVRVKTLAFDQDGPAGDRRMMLTDPANGRFLSQRSHPQMAMIQVRPDTDGGYSVSIVGKGSVHISPRSFSNGTQSDATVWKDRVGVCKAPEPVNRWFSEALGHPAELVRLHEPREKTTSAGMHYHTTLADASPVHLVSHSSLASLRDMVLNQDESHGSNGELHWWIARFRPNIVVDGFEPFEEDDWQGFTINGVRFDSCWPCERCVMIDMDPDSGHRDRLIGRHLITIRGEKNYNFGLRAAGSRTAGCAIAVGDSIVPI